MAIEITLETWTAGLFAIPLGTAILLVLIGRLLAQRKASVPISHTLALLAQLLITAISVKLGWDAWKSYPNPSIYEAITFKITGVSLALALIANFAFLIAVLFSLAYLTHGPEETYYSFLFAVQGGMMLVFAATDFFALFVAWELMALAGYSLVSYYMGKEAAEAAFKYLIMSSYGSLTFLFGMGLLYLTRGTLSFSLLQAQTVTPTFQQAFIVAFMILGFGVTASIVLANQWLPDAHPAAPAPVSMILSGSVVVTGIYGIFVTLDTIFPTNLLAARQYVTSNLSDILLLLALITMFEGNFMVFAQLKRKDSQDFKRILAYSTTVHMGFLLLALGIGSLHAIQALIFHVLNHLLAKGLLFLMAGYGIHVLKTRQLDQLRTLFKQDLYLKILLFIGLFSLGGVPGTGGFLSKFYILLAVGEELGTHNSIHFAWLLTVLVLAIFNSALAFIGYLWLAVKLTQGPEPIDETLVAKIQEAKSWRTLVMKLILGLLTLLILVLGFYPNPVMEFILRLIS